MNHVARALVYFEITAPLCIENMNPAATRERIDRVLAGSLTAACDHTHTHSLTRWRGVFLYKQLHLHILFHTQM